MMHPRVGGTFTDLFVRCFCSLLGSICGAIAYRAGGWSSKRAGGGSDDGGNEGVRRPIAMALLSAVFLILMLYRFTQSSHPRSGFIGCVSFVVVSLELLTANQEIVKVAWPRGLAFVVGIISAVTVNYLLWPFVARHELRKSISSMMLHMGILYRGVIAKYIYYKKGEGPTVEDVERSEMLEGRLREGFVRCRQVLELTRHEIVSLCFFFFSFWIGVEGGG